MLAGVIILAVSIPDHLYPGHLWDAFPAWYHVTTISLRSFRLPPLRVAMLGSSEGEQPQVSRAPHRMHLDPKKGVARDESERIPAGDQELSLRAGVARGTRDFPDRRRFG